MTKLLCLALLLFAQFTVSGDKYEWLRGGSYNTAVPTPESVLGYQIGTYLTDHLQMVAYMQQLARSSNRVQIFEYGQTYEGRKMYLLAISSPKHMERLEEIRTEIARLKDPRRTDRTEADKIAREVPPIGWVNFGTDGNETSAFECALQLAYQLAAGTDPLTLKILENVVVILNPCLSPDSHQWFATWAKAVTTRREGNPDPQAAEHESEWIVSSDGNHYLVDVNRDAFALTQAETQAAARVLHHWNPQIWVDNHGQPEEYFFAPFAAPVNMNYPPEIVRWATEIGRSNARYFDRYGWTYVKEERYDLYYPGYWDAYPSLSGAIGMTYETNGGGTKGFAYERSDGTVATLRESIHAHFLANMSSLEVLADNREAILKYFYTFRKAAMEEADGEPIRQFILPPGTDPQRTDRLVELCLRHGFEIYQTDQPVSSKKTQTYFDRETRPREFPAGSYVIPLRQPQKRLLKTLFEPDPRLQERFLKEVHATIERNKKLGTDVPKEPLWFYDVTAWALPVTFGIHGAAFVEDPVPLSPGEPLKSVPPPQGSVAGGKAGYAYLFPYQTDAGAKLGARLLQEGYNVSLALKGFTNGGKEHPKGTLVARVERNPDSLHERIAQLTARYGASVDATNSGWAESGMSFGSVFLKNLKKPAIMVLTNEPTQATAYGGVYSLLDQRFDIRFTAMRGSRFANADLSRYNVIIFPDGSPAGYQDVLGDSGVAKLKEWIRQGGTFIGIRGGAAFATRKGVELTDVTLITEIPDKSAGREGATMPVRSLPGAIFRGVVNNDYYLGIAEQAEIAVQVRGSYLFSPTRKGANVVTFPEKSRLMGHVWEETEGALHDKTYLADVPIGRGHVILFADDPTFRAYWQGLDRLFLAAVMFAPAMER